MTRADYDALLSERGIKASLNKGDRLILEPAAKVTPELRVLLKQFEQEMIAELKAVRAETVAPKEVKKSLKTITAKELMAKPFSEMVWVVPGLLLVGLIILAGRPKLGKSWLALANALAVALGGRVLGRIAVERGEVLYAGLEDGERRLQDRIDQLLGDTPPPESLHLITQIPRLDEGGLGMLLEFLEEHPEVRLVVIDTWARVRPQRKGGSNAYDDDVMAVAPLQRLAIERNIAVLLIHHTRKASAEDPFDTISGSTGLTGVADALLILARGRNDDSAILKRTGRDVEETDFGLKFHPSAGTWTITDDVQLLKMTPEARAVIEALRDGPLTPKELAECLGTRDGTMRSRLHRMHGAAQVTRLADGRYDRHFRLLENEKRAAEGPRAGELPVPRDALTTHQPQAQRDGAGALESNLTGGREPAKRNDEASEPKEKSEPDGEDRRGSATNEQHTTNETETTGETPATPATDETAATAEPHLEEVIPEPMGRNAVAPTSHPPEVKEGREERARAHDVSGVARAAPTAHPQHDGTGGNGSAVQEPVLAYGSEMILERGKLLAATGTGTEQDQPTSEMTEGTMMSMKTITVTPTTVTNDSAPIDPAVTETALLVSEIESQMLEHLKTTKGITGIDDPALLIVDEPDEDRWKL